MESFSLQNKTAVVTGGGSGIGEAIARTFAAHGAEVHLLDLNPDSGESVANAIRTQNLRATFHPCDVSRQRDVVALFDALATAGAIDILVNNAGISHIGNAESTSEADLDRVYSINVKGVYNCLHAALPHMKKRGSGCIVNMASIASVVGLTDRFAYSMSKGAVLSMTYSVAKDYLPYHIRCNAISPARVHTPFVDGFLARSYKGREQEMFEKLSKSQPIGRMGKPEEVADLALFLCSDNASFITGTNFPIDGGFIKLNS